MCQRKGGVSEEAYINLYSVFNFSTLVWICELMRQTGTVDCWGIWKFLEIDPKFTGFLSKNRHTTLCRT